MVMTGGKYFVLVLMAILNLGIGFGIARLLWRRNGVAEPSPAIEAESGQIAEKPSTAAVGATSETMTNVPSGSAAIGDDLVDLVTAELERAERRLQRLLDARVADENASNSSSVIELNCIAQELPGRLKEVVTRMSSLLDGSQPPPEVMEQTTRVLDSLSAQFAEAALQPGVEPASEAAVQLASQHLMTACQQARGAMIAVRFAEQHL